MLCATLYNYIWRKDNRKWSSVSCLYHNVTSKTPNRKAGIYSITITVHIFISLLNFFHLVSHIQFSLQQQCPCGLWSLEPHWNLWCWHRRPCWLLPWQPNRRRRRRRSKRRNVLTDSAVPVQWGWGSSLHLCSSSASPPLPRPRGCPLRRLPSWRAHVCGFLGLHPAGPEALCWSMLPRWRARLTCTVSGCAGNLERGLGDIPGLWCKLLYEC